MRVALFATCVVDQLVPDVGLAVLAVLERAGQKAVFPRRQTCCGQPFYNAGYREQARRLARATVELLAPYDAVVVPSGSCAAMMSLHYGELFGPDDPFQEQVRRVGSRTYEFSRFLTEVLEQPVTAPPTDRVVTYHDGCHSLRDLGIGDGPRRLLAGVPGCRVVEMDPADRCCGFGGSFSVTFDAISASMGSARVDQIAATGADTVVSCDPSCLVQLAGVLERRGIKVAVVHLAELLAGLDRR